MSGYKYRVAVSNTSSPVVLSNGATLIVIVAPTIITIAPTMTAASNTSIVVPINVINCNDVGAISWTLNYDPSVITYTGFQNADPQLNAGLMFYTNDIGGQFYLQWFSMIPANIGTATILELTFNFTNGSSPLTWAINPAGTCEYGNDAGNSMNSIWINGIIGLTITGQPANASTCAGGNTSFTVVAPGATTYQWRVSDNNGLTWTDLTNSMPYSGVNTNTLNITGATALMNDYLYDCRIDAGLPTATLSNAGTLTINPYTVATGIIQAVPGTTICTGTPVTFSLLSAYNFSSGSFTWFVNNVPSGSGSTFTSSSLVNGDVIKVDVIDGGNCTIASVPTITMSLDPVPVIVSQPANVIAVVGEIVTYTVTATSYASLIYQWQMSIDGGTTFVDLSNVAPFSGVNTQTLTINSATLAMNSYKFRVVVTEGLCGNSVVSTPANLLVFPAAIVTTLPNVSGCAGTQVVIPVLVDNFINVTSASLKFNYDPGVLDFVNYQNAFPGLTADPASLLLINPAGNQF